MNICAKAPLSSMILEFGSPDLIQRQSNCGASWISSSGRLGVEMRGGSVGFSAGGDSIGQAGGLWTAGLWCSGFAAVNKGVVWSGRGQEISARTGVVGPSGLAP